METKNLSYQPANLSQCVFRLPLADPASQPIQACSRDYGFDFDEDELGRELLAPLPASLADRGMPKIDAEDFQSLLLFIS